MAWPSSLSDLVYIEKGQISWTALTSIIFENLENRFFSYKLYIDYSASIFYWKNNGQSVSYTCSLLYKRVEFYRKNNGQPRVVHGVQLNHNTNPSQAKQNTKPSKMDDIFKIIKTNSVFLNCTLDLNKNTTDIFI